MQSKITNSFKNKYHLKYLFIALVSSVASAGICLSQVTVSYAQQTGEYDLSLTTSGTGGIYNNGSSEIGMWMNGDNSGNSFAGNVLWKTFRIGSATSSSARPFQVGDEFTITVATKGFYYGTIGVSLNSGSLPSATWGNRIANSRIRIQQDGSNFGGGNPGSWYYSAASAASFNITPSGSYVDYVIKVKLIAQDRCNVSINGNWAYDVALGGTAGAAITHYAIYMSDDRAGIWSSPNRGDSYWKQTTQNQNTGSLNFGSSNSSFSISDALFNGRDASSTSNNALNNSLTKSGTGTLTLAGANTYAGSTSINGGTLRLGITSSSSSSGPLGTTAAGTTITSGAVLDMNGYSLTGIATEALTLNGTGISNGGALINSSTTASEYIGAITLGSDSRVTATSGNVTLSGNLNGGSNSLYIGGSNSTTVSGIISGNGGNTNGSVFKDGSGTLILSGPNTYDGGTRVTAGTLQLGTGSSSSSSGPLGTTAAGTTVSTGAALDLNGHSLTGSATEAITLNGDGISSGGALLNSSASNATLAGVVTIGPGSRINVTQGDITLAGNVSGGSNVLYMGVANTKNAYISSILSGSGATQDGTITSLYKDNTGTLTLSGANSYTGDTRIVGGSVTVASGGSLGTGSDVFISSGATLNVNTNTSVASVQETGNSNGGAISIGTGATLTVNGADKGNMFQNSISGAGGLTMNGSGTSNLSLYGSQSYTGATTVSGGALSISVASSTSGITVSGGTLNLNHDDAAGTGTLTINSGTVNVNAARNITNAMSIGGNFTFTGTNNLTQTSGGISLTASPNITVSASTLSLGGVISGGEAITKNGSGILTLSGANTYTGATTISGGTLKLGVSSTSSSSGPLGTTAAGTTVSTGAVLDLNGQSLTSAATESLTLNGDGISSGGALINANASNVTYAGAITLGSGSRIDANQGAITLSGGITGGNNVLYIGGTGNTDISGIISGAGNTQSSTVTSLYKNNTGTLTLSGANSYTGDTRIVGGSLTVASGGSLGTGSDVFISSGATLNVNTNTSVASVQETGTSNGGVIAIGTGATLTLNGADKGNMFQNSISGAGGLTMNGSGTSNLSLYGSQSYTGATTVSGGALSIPVATSTSGITVSGGTLNLNHNNAAGSGTLTINSGMVNVNAARNISNAMSIGGDFTFTGTNTLTQTSGGITLTATPTITVSASTLSLGGAIGGSFGITKSGAGTLALAGVNTYSGLTTVSDGTLHINSSGGCIPSANDVLLNGGTLRVSYDQTLDELTATSGTITIDAGVTLTINNRLVVGSGVTINLNTTGKIAYGASGELEFLNSATISDAIWPTTNGPSNIEVNGTGITVTLDKARTYAGILTLTAGTIALGNFNLTITGTLTGGSSGAYIATNGTGKLILPIASASQLIFPVGNGAYSPITLNFTSGTFSSASASVKVAAAKHPNNISGTSFISRYWDVTQTGISSFNCNVTCTYQQSDVSGVEGNIYTGKYSGTTWTLGNVADVNNNLLVFNNANSFSDFSGGELSAMPVTWLFHHCKPHNGKVQLTWGVSEEPASGIYTIERSAEGRNWKALGTKTPLAPSFTSLTYNFVDPTPLTQNFYRIKYTENNGKVQFSEICHTQQLQSEKPIIRTDAGNNEISVSFANQAELNGTVTLYDATGRKLRTSLITGNSCRLSTAGLPQGIYELMLEGPGYRLTEKLMLTGN